MNIPIEPYLTFHYVAQLKLYICCKSYNLNGETNCTKKHAKESADMIQFLSLLLDHGTYLKNGLVKPYTIFTGYMSFCSKFSS